MNTCETCKHQHYSHLGEEVLACKQTGEVVFVKKTDTCDKYKYIWLIECEKSDGQH